MISDAQKISSIGITWPLKAASTLKRHGSGRGRSAVATLMLTSLVDAFSILVLFLMMNTGSQQPDIKFSDSIKLPLAQASAGLLETTTLRIEQDGFYVNNESVSEAGLVSALEGARTKAEGLLSKERSEELLIIADQEMDYEKLNPIILKMNEAGFSTLKFAVMQKK